MGYFVKGLSKRQREVFEQIALNNDKGVPKSTAEALIKKGLIEQYHELSIGGGFRIIRYKVPLPVHMEWCKWCSKQLENN